MPTPGCQYRRLRLFDEIHEACVADGMVGEHLAVVDDAERPKGAGRFLSALGVVEFD